MKNVQTAPRSRPAAPEYPAAERLASTRRERVDDEAFAVPDGSGTHSLFAATVLREIGHQLKARSCRVYINDLRLLVDDHRDTRLNAKAVLEVLSQSTEARGRGGKFWRGRDIESRASYAMISRSACPGAHSMRPPKGAWLLESLGGEDDALPITSIHRAVPNLETKT